MIRKFLITSLLIFSLIGNCLAAGNDTDTVSLLHMDGTDGATTFTDNAAGGTHTWTASGNAQIDTAQSKFGGASGLFDGTGDYIYSADSGDWHFADGLFTIDFWTRLNSNSQDAYLYAQRTTDPTNLFIELVADGGTTDYIMFGNYNAGAWVLRFQVATADLGFAWAANTWYHIALVREGTADAATSWGFYIDGTRKTLTKLNGAWNATLADIASNLNIGGESQTGLYLNGWQDEVRVSKGVARWTASFTPSTEEYNGAVAVTGQVIWIE